MQEGEIKDLNLIVKADVQGSVEAVRSSLEKLSNDEVRVRCIHGGVGAINESDISLAASSNAIVVGFNVRPDAKARTLAEREGVDVRLYRIIYDAIDEVKAAMKGMLAPKFKEVILGRAEVRQTFRVSGVGTIAGCMVTEGLMRRNGKVRLLRDNVVVFEGNLDSLKRFKGRRARGRCRLRVRHRPGGLQRHEGAGRHRVLRHGGSGIKNNRLAAAGDLCRLPPFGTWPKEGERYARI